MKFYIHTTGCKANQWDSNIIADKLAWEGYVLDSLKDADVVVVNACTVTDGAERDLRRFINRSRRMNGKARIILTGCHAEAYPDNSFGADLVLGQTERLRIGDFLAGREAHLPAGSRDLAMEEGFPENLAPGRTRFFYKIQDGCNKFCTYCIVPFARGTPRSRPVAEIVQTMEFLREKGIQEVVLTGIELAAFRDPREGMGLKDLLRFLERQQTPKRIRLSSIDPLYIDEEFMEIMAASRKIARSLHIPVQSGSDRILQLMGRRYSSSHMGKLLTGLSRRIEGIGIGLDVIAGFPGEDEELFLETYRFLDENPFYYLHVFPFSPRRGTLAVSMDHHVADTEKKRRVRRLKAIDKERRREFQAKLVGGVRSIIPEGKIYRGAWMRGYTDNYVPIYIPYDKILENNLVEVTIEGMEAEMLIGRVVTPQRDLQPGEAYQ